VVEEVVLFPPLPPVLLCTLPNLLAGLAHIGPPSGEVVGDVYPARGAEEVADAGEVGVGIARGSGTQLKDVLQGGLPPVFPFPTPLHPPLPLVPVGSVPCWGIAGSRTRDIGVAITGLRDGQWPEVFLQRLMLAGCGFEGL
jgi:hypothetical protein